MNMTLAKDKTPEKKKKADSIAVVMNDWD